MSNNNNSKHQQNPLQNNGLGMQNPNVMMPFMPNMQQPSMNTAPPLPFMNAANHMIPLQNNNHMHLPHMAQSFVGLGPQNPVYPFQGQQVTQNVPQMNLSQLHGQILAQGIMNMLQQQQQPNMNMNMSNMNMVNGQFCAPYPVQNMNQQLPMQMPNPSQVIPYGMRPGSRPMFGFPNQMPQVMVPQNPIFSPNPQMGLVPGNQVRPPVNQNEKNANAFSPQQSQRNDNSASRNPNSVTTSPGNPNSNVKTYVPHSNWKGSPNQNLKNKPNGEGFQGGFQKSKFHDINNGKNKSGFHKEQRGKGPKNRMSGHFGSDSIEHKQEPKRSSPVTYTEQEIQQWREARRKNHPSNNNIDKKQSKHQKDSKVVDREVLQKELKEVLAKQAELGVEVAEIPSYYLKDAKNQGHQGEGKNTFREKRKFKNKFNKKSNRNGRFGKKQKFADEDFSSSPSINKREPTLLQKLLNIDIKRDKSHLFQVFRFMVINSLFKDFPDKPLMYPSVVVKEIGTEGVAEEKHCHIRKDVLGQGDEKTVLVNHINDNCHDSEDEESDEDENDSVEHEEDGQIIKD